MHERALILRRLWWLALAGLMACAPSNPPADATGTDAVDAAGEGGIDTTIVPEAATEAAAPDAPMDQVSPPDAPFDAPAEIAVDAPLPVDAVIPPDASVDAADVLVVEACAPMCAGRACGSDGCGGSCGTCASGTTCSAARTCVAATAPRLLAPMSTSTVTSTQPSLRWAPMPAVAIDVELCRTRACATPSMTLSAAAGVSFVQPPAALAPGWWFWRARVRGEAATSETWQFWVNRRTTPIDSRWGAALDVNGDGFTDVAVSAPNARGMRGSVSVYYGSATGPGLLPNIVLEGPGGLSVFSRAVASAGDVNGDGFGDLLVGAPNMTLMGRMSSGAVYLYLGSPTGLSATPARVFAGLAPGDGLGASVAGLGDVNGDGYGDIAFSALYADRGATMSVGAVYVHHGGAGGPSLTPTLTLEGERTQDFFGVVAGAGDVNGDGFADLLVGAEQADPNVSLSDAGLARLYLGSATGLPSSAIRQISGTMPNQGVGGGVACAGDVNGDGYTDILIGAVGTMSAGGIDGSVSVYLGNSTSVGVSAAQVLNGGAVGADVGRALSTAGDVDGDGVDDIAIGARGLDNLAGDVNAGRVSIYRGLPGLASGVLGVPSIRIFGMMANQTWGAAVAGVGDVNGDGFPDLAVGSARGFLPGVGLTGAAAVYPGAMTSGTSTTALRTWYGEAYSDQFGSAISRAAP